MMRVLHKSWGVKTELFKNDLCEVSVLKLNSGQRCSWHRHRAKWNQFFVLEGMIEIVTEEGSSIIRDGQVFTTNPLQWHEFRTPDGPALVQEIMYVRYEAEDIERESKGGPIIDKSLEESEHKHSWVPAGQDLHGASVLHCPNCGVWRYSDA